MRIPSGVTDQYIYFVAVDITDLSTRETGLTGFTVYRSRNGGAAAAMTTPTINETDATNMPGVYELLLDEDMTIDSGDDSQEMCFHITQASMSPVTRTIELYRPKVTAGNTLDVTSTGAAGIDWGNVENQSTSVDLSATAINLCDTVTTNSDMRGTDNALLAASAPTNFADLAITVSTGQVTVGTNNDKTGYTASSVTDKTGYSISGTKTTLDALNDVSTADVNAQCDTALSDIGLQYIINTALPTNWATDITANSALDYMADDGTAVYDRTTDSLQALADSGGGGPTAAQIADAVWDEAQADHTTAATFGELATEVASILDDTGTSGVLVTGTPDVNVAQISADATAADNLEAMFDGTGYTDDNAPATQSQVGSLSTGSASISVQSESYVLTTGTQSSGTITDTETADGTYHQHTDTAGTLDLYYQFDVTGAGIATNVDFLGYLTGSNDSLTVQAYDWGAAGWDTLGTWTGSNSTIDLAQDFSLLVRHTGTGANLGKVRIRFTNTGLTTATLAIDQTYVSYSVVAQSAGYSGGAVWIDTTNGTAGTESYVNGTADNPVDNLANAITIASNVNLSQFQLSPDSTITFAESHFGEVWVGQGWACALGGQELGKTHITHARVSGACTSSTGEVHIHNSHLDGTTSLTFGGDSHFSGCKLNGTLTITATGNYILEDCKSEVAGASTPTIDMGAAVGATELSIRNWSGGLSITNVQAGDNVSLDGRGGNITINGTGGNVHIRGIFESVIDSSGGSVTIDQDADVITLLTTIDAVVDSILVDTDTTIPGLIAALNDLSTAQVNAEVVDVLKTDTITEMAQQAPPASPTFEEAVMYLYMALRNQITVTSSSKTFSNDAGTVIHKKALSDDGTTYTEAESTTGP